MFKLYPGFHFAISRPLTIKNTKRFNVNANRNETNSQKQKERTQSHFGRIPNSTDCKQELQNE